MFFLRITTVGRLVAAVAGALVWCASSSEPANAQFWLFDDYGQGKYRHRPAEPVQPRRVKRIEAAPPVADKKARKTDPRPQVAEEPGPALYAVVSIADQHVSIYGARGLIERSDISSGTQFNPTPTGVFAIIQKNRWHESNLYSGAPMPFMQRLTWSGVAMHQGQLPGYPASHGCIRLPAAFAARWFAMTKLGLRVIISPADIQSQPIAHAMLPVPRMWTAGPAVAKARVPVQSAGLSNETLVALAAPAQVDAVELDPVSYSAREKVRAKADLKAAERAEGEAWDAAEAAAKTAKDAQAELRLAERAAAAAYDRLAWFGLVGNRPPPSPRADYGDGLMTAIANHERANTRLGEARRTNDAAKRSSADAAEATKQADARTEALKLRVAEMGRRQETVSVLISRKDGRLYVRQGLRPVFDVEIAIADPDRPLGTHVYVAGPPATGERALSWTALSLPAESRPPPRVARLKRHNDIETGSIGATYAMETAAGALSRIQLPGEVIDRIAELVWVGSSMIVSDQGITHETGAGTDFIIQTKH